MRSQRTVQLLDCTPVLLGAYDIVGAKSCFFSLGRSCGTHAETLVSLASLKQNDHNLFLKEARNPTKLLFPGRWVVGASVGGSGEFGWVRTSFADHVGSCGLLRTSLADSCVKTTEPIEKITVFNQNATEPAAFTRNC